MFEGRRAECEVKRIKPNTINRKQKSIAKPDSCNSSQNNFSGSASFSDELLCLKQEGKWRQINDNAKISMTACDIPI